MWAGSLQSVLAGTLLLTLTVVVLSLGVLLVRRLLAPEGLVTVRVNNETRFEAPLGSRLIDVLAEQDILLPAACGGRGACGQCRVSVGRGAPPLTAVEAGHIPDHVARAGGRLACMLILREDLDVHVPEHLLAARRWICTVDSSRQITTLMKEIVLRLPDGETIDFVAGAYVLVEAPPHELPFAEFDIGPEYRSEWMRHDLFRLVSSASEPALRAYSMANPPAQSDRVMLTVRLALPPPDLPEDTPPGRASSWLFSLSPGDEVPVSGPFGAFRAMDTDREMVLIGGGAGVAPLRSILFDQLETRRSQRRISLWYGVRNRRELCYAGDFDRLASGHANFCWCAALSEPEPQDRWTGATGFVHAVAWERYLKDHPAPHEAEYYVCGPPLMNLAVLQMLEDLGVERESVFLDDFGGGS